MMEAISIGDLVVNSSIPAVTRKEAQTLGAVARATGMAVMAAPSWQMYGQQMYAQPQVYMRPATPEYQLQMQLLNQQAAAEHLARQQLQSAGGLAWQQAYAMPQTPTYYDPAPQAPSYYDPVRAFMQQLGIDESEEHLLGWIAELGLQAPLPPRWESSSDPSTGCTYYVDTELQTSCWENPLLPYLQRIVDVGRRYGQGPLEGFFQDAQDQLWREQKEDLEKWHGPFSNASGAQYYVNSATGRSSSRDPRSEAQFVFELQGNFLNHLQDVFEQHREAAQEVEGAGRGGQAGEEDAAHFWRTAGGAEVLTLDDEAEQGAARAAAAAWRLAALRECQSADHTPALREMRLAADWLRSACLEEEEVQRLKVRRLAEARRQRKAQRRGGGQRLGRLPSLMNMELAVSDHGQAPQHESEVRPRLGVGRNALRLQQLDEDSAELGGGHLRGPSPSFGLPPQGPPSPANFGLARRLGAFGSPLAARAQSFSELEN